MEPKQYYTESAMFSNLDKMLVEFNRLYTKCDACALPYSEINFGRSEILYSM